MKKLSVASAGVVLGLLAVGGTGCSSSGSKTAATTSQKAAFCAADVTLDKAGSAVNSPSAFLDVLKANPTAIAALQANAPSGKVGTEAKALVSAANSAVASNNANSLSQVPNSYGADVDTYCAVDGNGDPLPSYFGVGKGSAFCSVNDQISAGTTAAQSPADILVFLKAHQNLVNQVGNDLGSLPSSLKSEVQTLVATSQQAIATNNSNLLTQAIGKDAMDADLYCGKNS